MPNECAAAVRPVTDDEILIQRIRNALMEAIGLMGTHAPYVALPDGWMGLACHCDIRADRALREGRSLGREDDHGPR